MREQTLSYLQAMPVFGGLREDTLEFILGLGVPRDVPADGYFVHENDPGTSMFVLLRGKAAILKTWKGHEYLLRYSTPGDCFGEMSLIDLEPRSASVRAVEDSKALEITSADLFQIYNRDPKQYALILGNMGREVSRRLRQANQHLFETRVEAGEVDGDLHLG